MRRCTPPQTQPSITLCVPVMLTEDMRALLAELLVVTAALAQWNTTSMPAGAHESRMCIRAQ